MYDGIPIIVLKDGKGTDLLSTDLGDGSSSSIYVVTFGEEQVTGFQVSAPDIVPLTQADVYNYFNIEWGVGTAPQAIRSISRLRYVSEALS
jgi:hypothetical protein